MLPFGVTIAATVPQGLEIPEGLTNNPVFLLKYRKGIYLAQRKYTYKRQIEARSCDDFCRGKNYGQDIFWVRVFSLRNRQHEMCVRRVVSSSVACPPLQYLFTSSHKRYFLQKHNSEHQTRCFLFSIQIYLKYFSFQEELKDGWSKL
jgi:hypothetical protein